MRKTKDDIIPGGFGCVEDGEGRIAFLVCIALLPDGNSTVSLIVNKGMNMITKKIGARAYMRQVSGTWAPGT
jgi:hypothetical protein